MNRVRDDYSFVKWLVFGYLTLGIYQLYIMHKLSKDINKMCEEQNKKIPGLLLTIVLFYVTCGLYSLFWWFSAGAMLSHEIKKHEIRNELSIGFITACFVLGLIFPIASWVAIYKVIDAANDVGSHYNRRMATKEALEREPLVHE